MTGAIEDNSAEAGLNATDRGTLGPSITNAKYNGCIANNRVPQVMDLSCHFLFLGLENSFIGNSIYFTFIFLPVLKGKSTKYIQSK
jgi:hypothetical protein